MQKNYKKKGALLLAGWLFSLPVFAHSLHAIAQFNGTEVTGKAYYSDLSPASETYVESYFSQDPAHLISGKTDLEGRFRLPISGQGELKLVVEGEEGHRVEVVAQPIQQSPQTNQDQGLQLLREDIAQLKDKIYWHDIIGGIGYIVGLFGLIAWWQARKPQK